MMHPTVDPRVSFCDYCGHIRQPRAVGGFGNVIVWARVCVEPICPNFWNAGGVA